MEEYVLNQISNIANKYKIEKVVLFGSRARGDHSPVSDFDIAVFENSLTPVDKAVFCAELEEVDTLKKIDIVFVNENIEDELVENIKKEGVIIHGEARN
jgi:predicted nucleotidyltransferase